MDTIIFDRSAALRLNALLFQEEVEAALGRPVEVEARHRDGILLHAVIRPADGFAFTAQEESAVMVLAADHQPDLLSSEQLAEADKKSRRAAAADGLKTDRLNQVDDLLASGDVNGAVTELAKAVRALALLVREE